MKLGKTQRSSDKLLCNRLVASVLYNSQTSGVYSQTQKLEDALAKLVTNLINHHLASQIYNAPNA